MKLRRSLRCSGKFLLDCLYHTVFSKTSDFYGTSTAAVAISYTWSLNKTDEVK